MVFTISKQLRITANGEQPKTKAWKQFLFSFLASIPLLTHGIETTALSTSAHAGHFITTPSVSSEAPWNATALVLAAAVSAPLFCWLIDSCGRKSGLYFISLTQGASCIPLFLAPTEASQIVLHVLAGISSGGLFTVVPVYIREINEGIRALSLSLIMVMTTAGYMVELFLDIEAVMFLMVALITAQLLTLFVIVETPCYLITIRKTDTARKNLSNLLRLPEDSPAVTQELESLRLEHERVSVERHFIGILRNPIYRDATKIGIVLNTSMILCGSLAFLDQEKVLAQLRMTLTYERTLVLSCVFAGSLVCFCLVQFVERKYFLTSSLTLMVLSIGILAVYTQVDLTVATLRWVPVAALGTLVFAFGVAWGLPLVVMCEIYNFRIRTKMLGVLYTYSQFLKVIHINTFQYIEDYMGLYTVLYIFAGVNAYAAIYALFAIPDLKDKTVRQIERQLKRVPLLKFNTRNVKV